MICSLTETENRSEIILFLLTVITAKKKQIILKTITEMNLKILFKNKIIIKIIDNPIYGNK